MLMTHHSPRVPNTTEKSRIMKSLHQVVHSFLILMLFVCVPVFAQKTPKQERALTVVQASGEALDGKGKLWAVVIGVSSYRNLSKDQQLQYAHRDAQDFAAFLRSPNGGGFPANQVSVLLNQDATVSAMRSALGTALPRSVEPDDVVVIFFAGHGVVEGDRDGYLLAHDSDPQNLYATAMPIAELDRIVTERIKARSVILIADACHAGKLGWASRSAETQAMVNRYMEEVGKTGQGVLRILGSRADQRSYEGEHWGGGHGVFTHFLLKGLKGEADKDKDGFVRAAEVLDYLSEMVPKETKALQHPRAAGSIDPRLPLAVLSKAAPVATKPEIAKPTSASTTASVTLEIRGLPGSDVYLNNSFKGKIRPNGTLVIEQLKPGDHEFSLDAPGATTITQKLSLAAERTIVNVKSATPTAPPSSPLVAQIQQSLATKNIGQAWQQYQQLVQTAPQESQRKALEITFSSIFESIGQQAISNYVQASINTVSRHSFRQGAEAFRLLKALNATDPTIEAKYLFCHGRALIEENNAQEAINVLQQAAKLDPRAAYTWNALGYAYEKRNDNDKAFEAYKRAADLAPAWAAPVFHVGDHYLRQRKFDKAERAFAQAVQCDPTVLESRLMLVRAARFNRQFNTAETAAKDILQKFPAQTNPYLPETYLELAQIYETSGRYVEAINAFETILRIAPNRNDRDRIAEHVKELRKMTR
ncbi:MAG TPA: tetratricopeptide repeat protein [Blastocatellia bacterium]|nr:tetratricopeptide repeat protein [Blastocatellia bacterium]